MKWYKKMEVIDKQRLYTHK